MFSWSHSLSVLLWIPNRFSVVRPLQVFTISVAVLFLLGLKKWHAHDSGLQKLLCHESDFIVFCCTTVELTCQQRLMESDRWAAWISDLILKCFLV